MKSSGFRGIIQPIKAYSVNIPVAEIMVHKDTDSQECPLPHKI